MILNKPNERRQFWRSEFDSPAHVTLLGRNYVVRLLDISLKGALVDVGAGGWQPHAGERCHLRLELAPGVVIVMECAVAHVDGLLVGLRCDHIDLDSMTHLRHLVELNAENPDALERDLSKLMCAK
jgi:hypothetical protein